MAHANQERWAGMVDAKLRSTLVTRDNLVFNTRYEGSPKAGKVKIPVRDTEVSVKSYNKASGIDPEAGTTTYLDLNIDNDEAVNELIDGFDAASVPDGIVAERLDSAGYSLGLSIDKKSISALEACGDAGATVSAAKTACTEATAYKEALAAKLRQAIETLFTVIAPFFVGVSDGLAAFYTALGSLYNNVLKPLIDGFARFNSGVLGQFLTLLNNVLQKLTGTKDLLHGVGEVVGWLVGALSAAWAVCRCSAQSKPLWPARWWT